MGSTSVNEALLAVEKFSVPKDESAPVMDPVSNAALMKTIIETTSRLLMSQFRGGLEFCHCSLARDHFNHPVNLRPIGQEEVYTLSDYNASLQFAYEISQRPFTESHTLILSGLQSNELRHQHWIIAVPKIPRLVWAKITRENPWISSYLDSAAEVYDGTSNILLHASLLSPIWTSQDLDIALSTSDFSDVAQRGLREYLAALWSICRTR
ncbi:hypothetical protein B0H16DRAFT_1503871 [Mycena metata]|uniref:Uncharacterized protein n=1 Tax=Mycena metata TaxID=1033252 RepID=A0AAD7NW84_9AGAR|nr:hypothetical protein B0H16DRAFT_1503871 [Mycena metata]